MSQPHTSAHRNHGAVWKGVGRAAREARKKTTIQQLLNRQCRREEMSLHEVDSQDRYGVKICHVFHAFRYHPSLEPPSEM
jgi:hypothetical protein